MFANFVTSILLIVTFSGIVTSQSTSTFATTTRLTTVSFPIPTDIVSADADFPWAGSNHTGVRVTALAGVNNQTVLQCWQLGPDPSPSRDPATFGAKIQSLSDFKNETLVVYQNFTYAAIHPAVPLWITFLAGGGYIRVPSSNTFLSVRRGDIFILNDTTQVSAQGHDAFWFSGTASLRLPFNVGSLNYTVANRYGACSELDDSE